MNTHQVIMHHVSKKGCECRFLFPFNTCDKTHIHEDRGVNDEHVVDCDCLDGTIDRLPPFMILSAKPMGCEFINVHNDALSEILIATQMFKLEIERRSIIQHCTTANQLKLKRVKNKKELVMQL